MCLRQGVLYREYGKERKVALEQTNASLPSRFLFCRLSPAHRPSSDLPATDAEERFSGRVDRARLLHPLDHCRLPFELHESWEAWHGASGWNYSDQCACRYNMIPVRNAAFTAYISADCMYTLNHRQAT